LKEVEDMYKFSICLSHCGKLIDIMQKDTPLVAAFEMQFILRLKHKKLKCKWIGDRYNTFFTSNGFKINPYFSNKLCSEKK